MPYSIDELEKLPDNVKELPAGKRKVWINTFNSAYKACLDDKNPKDECESSAFAQAYSVVEVKALALADVPDTYTENGERETYHAAYNTFYAACMGGTDGENKRCAEGSHSAGQSAVKKKRKKALDQKAEDYSTSSMIAFYLPEAIASQIALDVPGAIPASELHLTLCFLGKATDMTKTDVDNIKRAVSLWAKQQVPVDVRINGLARFTKTTDEGMQPLVALLDSKHLKSLQYSLDSYVRYDGGYEYDTDHAFMPHITLGYLPQGGLWPIQNLPELKFPLKSVVFKVGKARYDLELTGEMTPDMSGAVPMPILKAGARNNKLDMDSIQIIHDKASHLGANCKEMDEYKALEYTFEHYGIPPYKKAYDLERQAMIVRQAWYAKYDPPQPNRYYEDMSPMKYWVKNVLDDSVIVEHYETSMYYRYEYMIDDGVVTFSDDDPVRVKMDYTPVGKSAKSEKFTIKTFWTCAVEGHEHDTPEEAQKCIDTTSLNTPLVRAGFFKSIYADNCLKTISKTADELTVANYIVLFGGRDLEGIASHRINGDGSRGEYFTKNTGFDSDYTATGQLLIDWEHRSAPDSEGPDAEDIFGYVDWKSAIIDETGLFVNRVLNRRNKYVKMLEALFDAGIIGSSSEPVQKGVKKGLDGGITMWPLKRDSFSVSPMDPRMLSTNHLEMVKSLRDSPEGHEVYQAVFHTEVAAAQAAALSLISHIGATRPVVS